MWAYVGTIALVAGTLLRVRANGGTLRLSRTLIVLVVLPIALVCLSHFIIIWLMGIRLARSAGLSLRDYAKSDAYMQNGREVLRHFGENVSCHLGQSLGRKKDDGLRADE